jgi:hypothetical protein
MIIRRPQNSHANQEGIPAFVRSQSGAKTYASVEMRAVHQSSEAPLDCHGFLTEPFGHDDG